MTSDNKGLPCTNSGKEYWVIDDSQKKGVFATEEQQRPKGYIPRKIGEEIIGRKTKDAECVWFTKEQIDNMRAHPEWKYNL